MNTIGFWIEGLYTVTISVPQNSNNTVRPYKKTEKQPSVGQTATVLCVHSCEDEPGQTVLPVVRMRVDGQFYFLIST